MYIAVAALFIASAIFAFATNQVLTGTLELIAAAGFAVAAVLFGVKAK